MKIICFGLAKEITGSPVIEIPDGEATNVGGLRKVLLQKYPKFIDLSSLRVAVDQEYAEDDVAVSADSEIVLIPPVSGG